MSASALLNNQLRATKILATLGSASTSQEQIKALVNAGANIFRMNFSHGTHGEHLQRINAVRAVEKKQDNPLVFLPICKGPNTVLEKLHREQY